MNQGYFSSEPGIRFGASRRLEHYSPGPRKGKKKGGYPSRLESGTDAATTCLFFNLMMRICVITLIIENAIE